MYEGMNADQILGYMRVHGYTQDGVNRVYQIRGLGNAPTLPASLVGGRQGAGRDTAIYNAAGQPIHDVAARNFLNTLGAQAIDPYHTPSGISNIAGGVLNAVGSAVGGPVWGAMTGIANAANSSLHPNESSSSDFGRYGAIGGAIGSIYGAAGGPGSYGNTSSSPVLTTSNDVQGLSSDLPAGTLSNVASGTDSALPEIVVNGTRGTTLGQVAGIGGTAAGVAGGMINTSDPVKSFQTAQTGGNAGQLVQNGGISGGAGGGTASGFGGSMGSMSSGDWVNTLINVGGALYNANTAKHAGDTQAAGAAAAIAEQQRQYDQNRADLAPYRAAGGTAIGQLSAGTADGGEFNRNFTAADFVEDPGYQFRMDQGSNAIQGANAATRGVQNGRTLAELARYGQDYASGEYSNAYNRFNNDNTTRFNRLASVAGIGQQATNTGVASGSNTANNVSDLTLQQANATAAGNIGAANAYTQGAQSLADFYRNRKYGGANTNWIGG